MLRFANDGGPLIIAPCEPRPLWEGVRAPSGGRVVESDTRTVLDLATDYDRACDVKGGAALLPAGDGWVVVLRAESEAMWLPAPPPGIGAVAVGISDWDGETTPEGIASLHARCAASDWTLLGDDVPLGEGGLALMHAGGERGEDTEYAHDATRERHAGERDLVFIGDAIVYPLPPGRYRVEAYEHLERATRETVGEYLVLVRFVPVAPRSTRGDHRP